MTLHDKHFIHGSGFGGGGKGGGGEGGGGKEDPNTLRSKATMKVIDLLGEGEIKGLVNGARSIYFDNTPLQNEAGGWNFDGVSYSVRVGLPDQAYIPGFDAVEAESGVGVQMKEDNPIVKTLADPDYTAATVTIRLPALARTDDEGNIKSNSVSFVIRVRYQGGAWVNPFGGALTISGKTNSTYDRQYYFKLPIAPSGDSAPWEIEVTRASDDSGSIKNQNDTYLSSYKGLIERRFSYPHSALVGIIIDAEQFGSNVPQRQYEVYGRIIQVPSNYDPASRSYSGLWNGVFKEAWTDNPAWIIRDIVTNDRFGLGEFIDPNAIDKWGLYEIAQYCDQLVPNGYGGYEPRFTFNGVIGSRSEAYDLLSQVASCFRGMAYWSSGAMVFSQDSPKDPVVLAHPANVIDGLFDYQSSALKARHTVAMVKWNDPRDQYRASVEPVQLDEGVLRYGYRDTAITATGCTSRGQAHRIGLWTLLSELYETQTITYRAGLDHAGVRPGDLVAVQDPSLAGNDFGGRLREGSTSTQLLIDHAVTMDPLKTYTVSVQMPDGSVEESPVNYTLDGGMTLGVALSHTPDPQAMWVVTSSSLAPQLYRVISIREVEPHIYEVVGLEYEPSKFDAVDLGTRFEELDVTDLPSGPLPKPTELSYREYLFLSGGTSTHSGFNLSVTVPDDPRISQLEWQYRKKMSNGLMDNWSASIYTGVYSVDVNDTGEGVYDFRCRARNALGGYSDWDTLEQVTLLGLYAPPANVTNFRLSVSGATTTFTWSVPSPLGIDYYEIRYSTYEGGVDWASSVTVATNIRANAYQLPTARGTYLIRAVSYKGVQSLVAAQIVNEIERTDTVNIVQVLEEAPGFVGAKQDVTLVSGELRLDSQAAMSEWVSLDDVWSIYIGYGFKTYGYYYFDNALDLGINYTSRLSASFDVYGKGYRNRMARWPTLASVAAMETDTSELWDFELEYRTTDQDPASSFWSEWKTFVTGDYKFRAIQCRMKLSTTDPYVTPSVRDVSVTVDMPDRVISGSDIVVPTAGLLVLFEPAFRHLSGLTVGDQDCVSGDRKVISSKDEAGFFIRYFNSAGTPVSRTFDYNAIGYGESANDGPPRLPPGFNYIVRGSDYILSNGDYLYTH